MKFFKRTKRIGKAHLNTLIKSLERSKPVIEEALKELEQKGLNLCIKANELESTIHSLQAKKGAPEVIESILSLQKNLRDRSKQCKVKYDKLSLKLNELEARKEYALVVKSVEGELEGELGSIFEEAESFVTQLENEAKAVLEYKEY